MCIGKRGKGRQSYSLSGVFVMGILGGGEVTCIIEKSDNDINCCSGE